MPCKISKKHFCGKQTDRTPHIRIGAEQYQEIIDLSNSTGRSISDISTRLLEYALSHAEVVEAEAE